MFKRIAILCKPHHASASELAAQISAWLAKRGVSSRQYECADELDTGCDLLVTLGGDGTILGAGRHLINSGVPVFGINFGKVGFLTGCEPDKWEENLERILAGGLERRSCAVLRWKLRREKKTETEGVAINEIVVARGSIAKLLPLEISIDNRPLCGLRCDGALISSPIGSSGYNSSAGGPILSPGIQAFILTAICPFFSTFSPIVLDAHMTVQIKMSSPVAEAGLTVDGQTYIPLLACDVIDASCIPNGLILLASSTRFTSKLSGIHGAFDAECR